MMVNIKVSSRNPIAQLRQLTEPEVFMWNLLEFLDHAKISVYGISLAPDNLATMRKNCKEVLGFDIKYLQRMEVMPKHVDPAEKRQNLAELKDRQEVAVTLKPQDYLQNLLNGKVKYNRHKFEAAKALLPYTLPKLNSVDIVQKTLNVTTTHEEFVKWAESEE